MYKFETVIGSQSEKPKDIDTESSKYVVYIRRNIRAYEERDDQDQITFKGWKYEECVVPNNNYLIDKLTENKEMNETIMLGLCDIYTQQLGEVE